MSKTVIKVENLFKEYHLGNIGYGTLREDLSTWWAKVRGKEDPNSLIGHTKNVANKILDSHFLALNDVSFEIKEGEAIGIVGKNGAGKSTLLKLLSRITYPTSGSIKVRGRISSLLEVGTGFHPELTGRENIYLNGAILGMKKYEIDKKIDEIIDFSGIEKFIDTPVKRYSSGMYVRLAFAVAAHLESDILILDEVLAVGDAEFQKKCLGKMDDVTRNQGRTILFVSHNMDAIKSLCTRGILLKNGILSFEGTIPEIIKEYSTQKTNNDTTLKNSLVGNNKNRRGSGALRFTSIESLNNKLETVNEFKFGDSIIFKFNIEIFSELTGVIVAIMFRKLGSETPIATIKKVITENQVLSGDIIDLTIEINDILLKPDMYSLYYWVGDLKAAQSGSNYDVVDDLIDPITINPDDNFSNLGTLPDGVLIRSKINEYKIMKK